MRSSQTAGALFRPRCWVRKRLHNSPIRMGTCSAFTKSPNRAEAVLAANAVLIFFSGSALTRNTGANMSSKLADAYLRNIVRTYRTYQEMAERAMEQVPSEEDLNQELDESSNSIAIIVKHMSGN